MISFGDTVIVGLSGGADSMTLLHLLNEIKDEYSLKIVAAHVNHCLRGDEADRDMNFCENVCKKLGIEIRTLVVDVQSEAKKILKVLKNVVEESDMNFFLQFLKMQK